MSLRGIVITKRICCILERALQAESPGGVRESVAQTCCMIATVVGFSIKHDVSNV